LADKSTTQLWSKLNLESMFEEYSIDAVVYPIAFEVNIDGLFRALRSYNSSSNRHDEVWMRLTTKNKMPYVVIMFRQHSFTAEDDVITIAQEIPIRLLRVEDVQDISEPNCPPANVYILMRDNLSGPVVRISERYRQVSPRITVRANNRGLLSFEVHDEGVKIDTTWKNAVNTRTMDQSSQDHDSPETIFSVTVDSKEWWAVLQVVNVAKRVIMGICDRYALLLYCYISDPENDEEEVMTYYMSHSEM
jgi:HUS1 checkpoint protein